MENASDIFMVMSSEENMQWWNIGFCYGCSTTYNPQKNSFQRHLVLGHKTQNYYLLINHFLNPFFP